MLVGRNAVFLEFVGIRIANDDLAAAALDFSEFNHTVNLRNIGDLFRCTGLEQLGNTRKTACNIFVLELLTRHTGKHHTRTDFRAFLRHDERSRRKRIVRKDIAVLILDDDLRMEVFPVRHHCDFLVAAALRSVQGDVFDQIEQFNGTCIFRNDRQMRGIPCRDPVVRLHFVAILLIKDCTDFRGITVDFRLFHGI